MTRETHQTQKLKSLGAANVRMPQIPLRHSAVAADEELSTICWTATGTAERGDPSLESRNKEARGAHLRCPAVFRVCRRRATNSVEREPAVRA